MFLGLALLHRYKNSRSKCHFSDIFAVLPEADQTRAEVLGKAMRFGAMLAMDKPAEQRGCCGGRRSANCTSP